MLTAGPFHSIPICGPSSQIHQYPQLFIPYQEAQLAPDVAKGSHRPVAQPLQQQSSATGFTISAHAYLMPAQLQSVEPFMIQSSHGLQIPPPLQAVPYAPPFPPTPFSAVPTLTTMPAPAPAANRYMQLVSGPFQPHHLQHTGGHLHHHSQKTWPTYTSVPVPKRYPARAHVHGVPSVMPMDAAAAARGMPLEPVSGMIGSGSCVNPEYDLGGSRPMPFRPFEREGWQGEWDDRNGYDKIATYRNTEVQQRRRTTVEQLEVLEHWFDTNPRPDNARREWLAEKLGLTKRNVQVWCQNRRAKVKGIALKEKSAAEMSAQDQETGDITPATTAPAALQTPIASPGSVTLKRPTVHKTMGRRVSLAYREAISMKAPPSKRAAARKGILPGKTDGTAKSTVMAGVSAARRGGIRHPAPLALVGDVRPALPFDVLLPLVSTSIRPTPSQLHVTAAPCSIRPATMSGVLAGRHAQLLSSGPFAPPRVMSSSHSTSSLANRTFAVKSINDNEHDTLSAVDWVSPFDCLPIPYLGSLVPTGRQRDPTIPLTKHAPPGPTPAVPTVPFVGLSDSPLSNPLFSCSSSSLLRHSMKASVEENARAQDPCLPPQQHGMGLGSIADINTFDTETGPETRQAATFGERWQMDEISRAHSSIEGFQRETKSHQSSFQGQCRAYNAALPNICIR